MSVKFKSYLSEHVPAPDNLGNLFGYIEQEADYRRTSRFSAGQKIAALFEGSRLAYAAYYPDRSGDVSLDASHVQRNRGDIRRWLRRLIMPDDCAAARVVIIDVLSLCPLGSLAQLTTDLDALLPEAVTALLELRVSAAEALIKAAARESRSDTADDRLAPGDFDFLVEEYHRVRIAFLLRSKAQRLAARLHSPFNWSALDELDGSLTLRFGTFKTYLQSELARCERALALYTAGRPQLVWLPSKCLSGSQPVLTTTTVSFPSRPCPAGSTAEFEVLELDVRAHVQLAIWRAEHGDEFEELLDRTIADIKHQLAELTRLLEQENHHSNIRVGHIRRVSQGVELYLASQEAIAWVNEPVDRREVDRIEPELDLLLAYARKLHPSRSDRVNGIVAALLWAREHPDRRGLCPAPAIHRDHADMVHDLFSIYRFCFLHDDELLPVSMRSLIATDGIQFTVKTQAQVREARGTRYSFSEFWRARQSARRHALRAMQRTDKTVSRREPTRTEIARSANKLRKMARSDMTVRQLTAIYAFRASIVRGFARV